MAAECSCAANSGLTAQIAQHAVTFYVITLSAKIRHATYHYAGIMPTKWRRTFIIAKAIFLNGRNSGIQAALKRNLKM